MLNTALLAFAKEAWPKLKEPQGRLGAFLYQGLGRLFLERSGSKQYWIMVTRGEDNFAELDAGGDVTWSGRKEMAEGDLVFMYRASPRKAITDVYRVIGDPVFDPWAG